MKPLRLVADGLVGSLIIVVSEAVLVALLNQRQFVGVWELRQGLRALPLLAWAMAAPVGALGALLLALLRSGDARPRRAALSALASLFGGTVAALVTTGRHFAALPLRAAFVVVVAAVGGAVMWALSPRIGKLMRERAVLAGAAALLAIAALWLCNLLVLPRLYPAFHAALAVLAVLLSPGVLLLWEASERPTRAAQTAERVYIGAAFVGLVATIAFVPRLAEGLRRADNVRYVFGERAPLGRYAVELLSAMWPNARDEGEVIAIEHRDAAGAVDFRGRDILLISIDALRADHVGCYGYGRPITPNIDALARTGARFERAYTATPHTSYAVASLMTGKYMRPLLLQGAGADSDTLAGLLRTYGYRTAGFYPPAVFFIDEARFVGLRDRGLDFEYRRVEFADAALRASQVETYLGKVRATRRVLLWAHLFEPHEPYVEHEGKHLGERDIDRYDGEIAAADEGVGKIVEAVRKVRPDTVVVVTADHGEEFGEHGGRFHGTTVYEEQVRVPLIVNAPGVVEPRLVASPVQTIDILPTVLSSLRIPRPARLRGHDLSPQLAGREGPATTAFAETDEQTLLARGSLRLVCQRKTAACRLHDLESDPTQQRDASAQHMEALAEMKKALRELEGAHGRYEVAGLRAEGRAWPEAIRRGIAGDGDSAIDVAALLDDADVSYRRKAAEVLFELARPETAPALRLSLTRDEDETVRRWSALSLARLGEGAGRALELVEDRDVAWRRLAALALAEGGDSRGEDVLVAWWQSSDLGFERRRQIAAALGKIRSKKAVGPLSQSLSDLRLRPYLAEALAQIGEAAARPSLLKAFSVERYMPARVALGRALVSLGAGAEMAEPLARFLGMPDPMPEGLKMAERGGFLVNIGGPDKKDLKHVRSTQTGTYTLLLIVPSSQGKGEGLRLVVNGRSVGKAPALLRVGLARARDGEGSKGPTEIDPKTAIDVELPVADEPQQIALTLPRALTEKSGQALTLAFFRGEGSEVTSLAVVPLVPELPPPEPEPWTPREGDLREDVVDDGS